MEKQKMSTFSDRVDDAILSVPANTPREIKQALIVSKIVDECEALEARIQKLEQEALTRKTKRNII